MSTETPTPSTETARRNESTTEDDEHRNFIQRWASSSMKDSSRTYRVLFYLVAISFLVTTLFPFYWLLVVALTPESNLTDVGLLPNGFNPEAIITVFTTVPFHIYMLNSLIIGLVTTALVLVIASLAGYAFGRFEFPGRRPLMLIFLAISYFPPAAFLLPLFELFTANITFFTLPGGTTLRSPMLFNGPGAMVLPYTALFLPLSIFILTTFYGQIPDGLEDAARVEGNTRLGALVKVIMPLSAPGLATAGVLTFIAVYNEYFFAFLMTDGRAEHWGTIVWGLLSYQGRYETSYNLMAAASLIGVIPIAILVVLAQEKIVSGLTAGGLKE
jgi:multiple sugar transport system permease protein